MSDFAAILRSTDLHALEQIVERGRETFVEVGMALLRIRDAELYKVTHDTWEAYCKARWNWTDRHARRLIVAAKLSTGPLGPVPTERHARELSRLEDPEEQAEALAEARIDARGEPTVAQVKAAVDRRRPAKPKSLQDRRTPWWLFDALQDIFGPLKLDAYASEDNALCERFYTREQNGHRQPWEPGTFWNPRFRDLKNAPEDNPVAKAIAEAHKGNWSVGLGPVGCSQAWYHGLAIQGTVYNPDLRISYDTPGGATTGLPGDDEHGADRDTIVMAFGPEHWNRRWKRGEFRVRRLELKKYFDRLNRGVGN